MTQSPEAIRAELARVVSSPGFANAGRLPGFLTHLVERTLAGDAASLKESLLGSEVFQRDSTFDPRTDPVVRVEARRLRSRLEEYYQDAGRDSTLRITLPKGGYVPVFETPTPPPTNSLDPAPPAEPEDRFPLPKGRRLLLAFAALAAVGIPLGYCQASYMKRVRQAPLAHVAVLPFSNLGGDPENDYFAAGLSEEIIDRLAHVPGLKVAAPSLMRQFKGPQPELKRVAELTQASVIVEGSVRRQGARLRVVARLSNPNDGSSLWSQTYDRRQTDIFAIQDEIAQSVAAALRVQVRAANPPPRPNLDAYNALLKARYLSNLYTLEGIRRSNDYCEEALRLQPAYAPALAQLSINYALLGYYGVLPPGEWDPKARQAAQDALRADPLSADAHAALGLVLSFRDWNWTAAEASFRRGLDADPNSSLAHGLYAAALLMPQRRLDEAQREFRAALALDPLSSFINYTYAFSLLCSGDAPAAVAQYRKTLELKNVHPDMMWDYAMALSMAGQQEEAAQAMRQAYKAFGSPNGDPKGLGAYYAGDPAAARRDAPYLEQLAAAGKEEYTDVARLYSVLGDKDKALHHLDQAIARHENQALWAKADPRFRPLHGLPRYQALLLKLGL